MKPSSTESKNPPMRSTLRKLSVRNYPAHSSAMARLEALRSQTPFVLGPTEPTLDRSTECDRGTGTTSSATSSAADEKGSKREPASSRESRLGPVMMSLVLVTTAILLAVLM